MSRRQRQERKMKEKKVKVQRPLSLLRMCCHIIPTTSRENAIADNAPLRPIAFPPSLSPNFFRVLERQYPLQTWGFVVFRTTAYDDPERWNAFRWRWNEIMMAQLKGYEKVPGMAAAKLALRFQWVEDPTLEGASIGELAA